MIFFRYQQNFAIATNRRTKTQEFYGIRAYGTCCWKICETRSRSNCEILRPGEHEPRFKFIHRGRMQVC